MYFPLVLASRIGTLKLSLANATDFTARIILRVIGARVGGFSEATWLLLPVIAFVVELVDPGVLILDLRISFWH
jgi:hypothetical protein